MYKTAIELFKFTNNGSESKETIENVILQYNKQGKHNEVHKLIEFLKVYEHLKKGLGELNLLRRCIKNKNYDNFHLITDNSLGIINKLSDNFIKIFINEFCADTKEEQVDIESFKQDFKQLLVENTLSKLPKDAIAKMYMADKLPRGDTLNFLGINNENYHQKVLDSYAFLKRDEDKKDLIKKMTIPLHSLNMKAEESVRKGDTSKYREIRKRITDGLASTVDSQGKTLFEHAMDENSLNALQVITEAHLIESKLSSITEKQRDEIYIKKSCYS